MTLLWIVGFVACAFVIALLILLIGVYHEKNKP